MLSSAKNIIYVFEDVEKKSLKRTSHLETLCFLKFESFVIHLFINLVQPIYCLPCNEHSLRHWVYKGEYVENRVEFFFVILGQSRDYFKNNFYIPQNLLLHPYKIFLSSMIHELNVYSERVPLK